MPFYHIVVAEKHRPVKGKFVEKIGFYNPLSDPKIIELKKERAEHWISVGAQPSETMARMLTKQGVSAAEKFVKERKMKPSKAELEAKKKEEEEKAKAAEEATAKEADAKGGDEEKKKEEA